MVPRRLILALAAVATPALAAESLDVAIGKALFERNWVSAPSSTKSDDGLGPLYDAPSCAACHQQGKSPPDEDSIPPGMVTRLGNARGLGDPVYGYQLQTRAVAGHTPEGNPDMEWVQKDGLRVSTVTLYSLGYGPLAADTRIALRRAPSLFGVGLIARVPESEILKRADPNDENHDGIAGRASYVMVDGKEVLGRFGWKATEPDLAAQTAMAFSRDIGLSTSRHPEPWGDCTEAERKCRQGPHGAEAGEVEVADTLADMIVKYLAALPASRAAALSRGQALFAQAGCAACHARLALADGTPVPAYTDLLLHDLGEGLNDGIKEGAAGPGVWRTAPLWNVAESLKLGGLLHDGRARNVAEAIQWHGGEGAQARARFKALDPADQAALAAFVSGL
jgi:CxxC motif-containing protein (DUF1111 family)